MLKKYNLFSLIFVGILSGCQSTSIIDKTQKEETNTFFPIDDFVIENILNKEELPENEIIKYEYGLADLNNDGRDELLVMPQSMWFCGSGGCNTFIFSHDHKLITRTSVTDKPILLSDNITNGFHDIIVWSNNEFRTLKFNGISYPENPSTIEPNDYQKRIDFAYDKIRNTELFQQDGYDLQLERNPEIFKSSNIHTFKFKHYGDPMFDYVANYNNKTDTLTIVSEPNQK